MSHHPHPIPRVTSLVLVPNPASSLLQPPVSPCSVPRNMEHAFSSRRKLNTACWVCRKRKVRCDAENGEPCTACKRAKLECRSVSIARRALTVVLTGTQTHSASPRSTCFIPGDKFPRTSDTKTTGGDCRSCQCRQSSTFAGIDTALLGGRTRYGPFTLLRPCCGVIRLASVRPKRRHADRIHWDRNSQSTPACAEP